MTMGPQREAQGGAAGEGPQREPLERDPSRLWKPLIKLFILLIVISNLANSVRK